ncbi:Glucose-repressible alcohol dehydrogenase transcriptional effector, partial [Dinochytrium kinnereticum]
MLLGLQQQNASVNQYNLQQQIAIQRQLAAANGVLPDSGYAVDSRGNGQPFGRHFGLSQSAPPMNIGLQERLYFEATGEIPGHFDEMEDSSMRMVDWVVGKESPQPPSDEEDDLERRLWMTRNAGMASPHMMQGDVYARSRAMNSVPASGPRTFANVAAGSLKESDLYRRNNNGPVAISSSPQSQFRQRPILPAYLADALGPGGDTSLAMTREAGRLRSGSMTRYGAGQLTVPHRIWKKGGTEKADSRHFMVMSYNVLAPMYCTESRYNKSERKFLDWDYRRRRILDEIAFYAPDFVCLQELPPSDFKEVFLHELQKIGYDGHFQAKKKEHAADGCAIFYLESRFSLMAVQAFAYSDQINDDPNSDLASRLAPFPNIALVCVFQNRQARSLRVRVVNTHLHWDPAFADTKLLQAAILMEWLERTHREVPTVIAADLNSRAGEAVVDYLVRGKVAPGALFGDKDFGRFTASLVTRVAGGGVVPFSSLLAAGYVPPSAANPPSDLSSSVPVMPGMSSSLPNSSGFPSMVGSAPNGLLPMGVSPLPLLRHGTKLASAYDRKDLPFTNKTPDFEGSIDHILYTSGTLSIRDVLADLDGGPLAHQTHPVYPAQALSPNPAYLDTPNVTVSDPTTSPTPAPGSVIPSDTPDRLGVSQPSDESTTPRTASPSDLDNNSPGHNTAESLTPPAGGAAFPQPFSPQQPPAPQHNHHQHHGYFSRVPSLPTEHLPSDHIPLVAWLKWKTVPVGSGPSLGSSLGGGGGNGIGMNPNGVELRPRPRGGRRGGGGGSNNPNQNPNPSSGSMGATPSFPGPLFGGPNAHLLSSSAPQNRSALMNSMMLNGGNPGNFSAGGGGGGGGFDNRPPLPSSAGGAGNPGMLQLHHQMQQQQQQQQRSLGSPGVGNRMVNAMGYFDPGVGGASGVGGRKYSLPGGLGSPQQQMMGGAGMMPR